MGELRIFENVHMFSGLLGFYGGLPKNKETRPRSKVISLVILMILFNVSVCIAFDSAVYIKDKDYWL